MKCLRCGCQGKHVFANGRCMCGCPAMVTSWAEEVTPILEVKSPPKSVKK